VGNKDAANNITRIIPTQLKNNYNKNISLINYKSNYEDVSFFILMSLGFIQKQP
jgi:hypothetical protein